MKIFKMLISITIVSHITAIQINSNPLQMSLSDIDFDELIAEVMKPLSISDIGKSTRQSYPYINNVLYKSVRNTPSSKTQAKTSALKMIDMNQPLQVPLYVMPQPQIVPMKAYYEPVIHDHPPIHEIRKFIEDDERKWDPKKNSDDNPKDKSNDYISSESDSISYEIDWADKDIDPVNYYNDFLNN